MDLPKLAASAFAALPQGLTATVRFTRTTPGAFDPLTSQRLGTTTTTWTATAVLRAPRGSSSESFEDNLLVRTRYMELTIQALGLRGEPEAGDMVTLPDAEMLKVVGVERVAPGGATALYIVTAERV